LFAGTSGYILDFGKDFQAGKNTVDDFGISVIIALDVSGSMGNPPKSGGDPKYLQASRAFTTITNYLEDLKKRQKTMKVQVAFLKFSDDVTMVLPMTEITPAGIVKIKEAENPKNFQPDGNTAIGSAIEAGSKGLAQSGTILNSLIIITDGESNRGADPLQVMDAVYSNRNSASTSDFSVKTATQLISFVGFDVTSPQFSQFHDHGARITAADSQVELEKGLKSFLEADITTLEGK
jgi:Mg-chelatase subunit ChlD